ncbi:flagellar basal body-associated FliL family protein [Abyssisolibacter fermentans]|uniref:flagellar basal body-associated FliL family protein n=1 Tax=Abyssisolibacter fermentans TaxID=1766203 RepID=UPI00082C8E43|nr:flagellar basal body-associated FliL family protein [Abyssisolibacter fermentans]
MKNKKVLIIGMAVLIVVLTIVGVIFGVMLYNNKNKEDVVETYTYDIGQIYSNLKESHRIIKCSITAEVTDEGLLEVFEKQEPKTKDAITKIFRNKNEKDVEGMQGQINLQKEIKQKLQEILDNKDITNIYFKEFIVQ